METTGSAEVPKQTDDDPRIATWQTGLDGVDWLTQLVANGRALSTTRSGYPDTYTIPCRDFITRLDEGLPGEHATWVASPHDIIVGSGPRQTTIDTETLALCDPNEWLLVEAWDES
jgi:hypothetical protein